MKLNTYYRLCFTRSIFIDSCVSVCAGVDTGTGVNVGDRDSGGNGGDGFFGSNVTGGGGGGAEEDGDDQSNPKAIVNNGGSGIVMIAYPA